MNISYSEIEAYCNRMHSLASGMKEVLSNIESSSSYIISAGLWNGNAAEKYCDKLKKVIRNFDEVFNEIENSILYLANSSQGYEAVDKQIMQEICSNLNINTPNLNNSKIFK